MENRGKKLVEVARSFSLKKNLGNYESADFFCSQKAECYEDEVEEVSKKLYQFAREQVLRDMNAFVVEKSGGDELEKAYKDMKIPIPDGVLLSKKSYSKPPSEYIINRNTEKNQEAEGSLDRENEFGERKV